MHMHRTLHGVRAASAELCCKRRPEICQLSDHGTGRFALMCMLPLIHNLKLMEAIEPSRKANVFQRSRHSLLLLSHHDLISDERFWIETD